MPTTQATYCRVCEAACGLVLERAEDGSPLRLRPDKDHPVSRGFACAKGTRFLETAGHAERVLYPMRRGPGGALERTSWDEALAAVGAKLRAVVDESGPHAVGVYFGNPMAFNAVGSLALLGFTKALGTRNVYSAGSQDCNNKFAVGELVHGSPVLHPFPDLEHAELAVFFGSNPAVSQSSFLHLEGGASAFDRYVGRGGQIVWVDPRRTESARRWGEHLPIRPGTDAVLLLALLNLLRDMPHDASLATGLDGVLARAAAYPPARAAALTGIPAPEIEALAARIRASRATAFHLSVGVNQSGFGTLAYVLVQALTFVTGNYDKRGGVLVHPVGVPFARGAKALGIGTSTAVSRVGEYPSTLDTLPGGILADEILTPGAERIRALIVLAGDPLRTMPDVAKLRRAFRALELLVVVDLFASETAREAHYVLPGSSWLERFDFAMTTLTFQTGPLLQFSPALLPPPGETRNEGRILADVARAMGGRTARRMAPFGWVAKAEAARVLDRLARIAGAAGRPFGGRGDYGFAVPSPKPGRYLGKGPRTPGHKLRFDAAPLAGEYARLESLAPPAPGTFLLMGRRRRLGHNGWLHGGLHDGDPEAIAWLNPDDAKALGLAERGGAVRIRNALGALELPAVANPDVAPGQVYVPHGVPGVDFNALVPADASAIDRLSGMHRMTAIAVEVTAVAAVA